MAALRLHTTLRASSRLIYNSVIKEPHILTGASPHLHFVRGRVKPLPWWQKRRDPLAKLAMDEISNDNKEFLREVAQDQYSVALKSPLRDQPWPRNPYIAGKTMRTGLIGLKIGVVPHWTTDGSKVFVTILQILDNHVIEYVPPEEYTKSINYNEKWRGRYGCVVVGALSCDPFMFTSQYLDKFRESGLPPKRKLSRFLVTPDAAVQPGTPLSVNHYKVGDYVDCQAKTNFHGFQGVVKRWGFKGGPASHGATKWHRRPGSVSSGRTLKRIVKGQKMPGLMGGNYRTLKGLQILRINTKYNLLFVKGPSLPGPTHGYVRILDTNLYRKRMLTKDAAMPTWLPEDNDDAELPEDIFHEKIYRFGQPTIMFQETATQKQKKKTKSKK